MDKQIEKLSDKYSEEKTRFHKELSEFAQTLEQHISLNGDWTVKGFIDVFKNIYTISADTKVISKILELHLFPHFLDFARRIGYTIELTTHQNWYPDLTFVNKKDILAGNGVFAKAGEEIFDDYWSNFGKIQVEGKDGRRKPITSFDEYVKYRGLSIDIKNQKASSKGGLK